MEIYERGLQAKQKGDEKRFNSSHFSAKFSDSADLASDVACFLSSFFRSVMSHTSLSWYWCLLQNIFTIKERFYQRFLTFPKYCNLEDRFQTHWQAESPKGQTPRDATLPYNRSLQRWHILLPERLWGSKSSHLTSGLRRILVKPVISYISNQVNRKWRHSNGWMCILLHIIILGWNEWELKGMTDIARLLIFFNKMHNLLWRHSTKNTKSSYMYHSLSCLLAMIWQKNSK